MGETVEIEISPRNREGMPGQKIEINIDQSLIAEYLSTSGFPDPELLIRTSGEMRISNFLIWISLWPIAFMNILPIPALDGGHVMFLLYEIITGRKPNDKFMEYAQMVGFFILIGLVLFANGNDVYRWLFD